MTDHDQLSRFLLPAAGVRGVHVRLTQAWHDIQGAADYPPAARQLLGEAAVAAALFTGHTKVDGRLSVQLRGNQTLRTLFAECTAAGTLRGIVQLADGADAPTDLRELGEAALLAITIENPGLDPREPQRYQSLVGMQAPDLAEAFETYFHQSEQLPTRLLLAAGGPGRRPVAAKAARRRGRHRWLDPHRRAVRHSGRTGIALGRQRGPAAPVVPRGRHPIAGQQAAQLRLLLLARAGRLDAAVPGRRRGTRRCRGNRRGRGPLRVLRA